jgi:hypothetical protein
LGWRQLHNTEGQVCEVSPSLQAPHLLQLLPQCCHALHCCQQQCVFLISQLPHLSYLSFSSSHCCQQLQATQQQ